MILVVIILVAWMIILGPNLLKRRSRTAGGINSISHFHHQLRVLEQSGPQPYVAPAFRLRSVDGSILASDGGEGTGPQVAPKLSVVGADQLPRPALAFLGRDSSGPEPEATDAGEGIGGNAPDRYADFDAIASTGVSMRPGAPPRAPDAYARQRARRRRRDTLGVLTMVFASTVLIGFVPGASAAWVLSAVTGVALVAYVALLVRMRQAAEERERKLHYLRPGGSADIGSSAGRYASDRGNAPYGTGNLPVRISGRYAHPSNQAAVAH